MHFDVILASVPGEPRKVKAEALNSTAVKVQWRPPADREHNGVIRGYLVIYVRLDDRDEAVGEARVHDVMDGKFNVAANYIRR